MRRPVLASLALVALAGLAAAEPLSSLRLPRLGADRLASLDDFRGEKVLLIEFASW